MHCMLRHTISVTCASVICVRGIERSLPSLSVRIWFTMRRLPDALRSGHRVFTQVSAATTLVWASFCIVFSPLLGRLSRLMYLHQETVNLLDLVLIHRRINTGTNESFIVAVGIYRTREGDDYS